MPVESSGSENALEAGEVGLLVGGGKPAPVQPGLSVAISNSLLVTFQ
jgi:ethanolamine utilization microcompartment shell protein EutL